VIQVAEDKYDLEVRLKQVLVCPHCGYDGNTEEGHGFRYLEDTTTYRDVEGVKDGKLVIHSLREVDEGYDHGNPVKLECRRTDPQFCGRIWELPIWVKSYLRWL
jgi:hypothetical protein